MKKILLAVLAVVVMVGCKSNVKEEIIRIGAILPLSGNSAVIGEPKKQAFDIAVEEYKKQGKIINVIYEDSEGTAKQGVSTLNKMISSKSADFYYVDLTTIVNSCVPIIEKNKVLTFAGSAEPKVTNSSEYLFRLFAGGDQEIILMLQYLNSINNPKIYILHTNELYGINSSKMLSESYCDLGGVIIGTDEYPMNNADFKSQLLKAKESGAEKIILLGYGNEYAVLLKQAYDLKISPENIICNLGGSNKVISELQPELIAGMVFVGPKFSYLMNSGEVGEKTSVFVNSFVEKFGTTPDFRAAYVYDTVSILLEAIERSEGLGLDRIMEEIKKIKEYQGVSGNITFLENGDSITDLIVVQYEKNGSMKCL